MTIEKYTEEERKLIKKSFQVTWHDFQEPLSLDEDEDIIKAVLKHKNLYHMGKDSQKIAAEIFRKNGLWRNGKTTLIEHDRRELETDTELLVFDDDVAVGVGADRNRELATGKERCGLA